MLAIDRFAHVYAGRDQLASQSQTKHLPTVPPPDFVTARRAPAGPANRQPDATVRSLPTAEGFRVIAPKLASAPQERRISHPTLVHGEGALAMQANNLGGRSAGQQRTDPSSGGFTLHAEDVSADAEARDAAAAWSRGGDSRATPLSPLRLKENSYSKIYTPHT